MRISSQKRLQNWHSDRFRYTAALIIPTGVAPAAAPS